jgi:hypothetical protein
MILAGERPAAAHLLRSWVQLPPGAWIFVCCEVEVSATSWSLVQRSPPDCGASLCDLETSRICTPYIYIYDISHLRVNLCAIYSWLASFTLRPLHRQKSPRYLWAAMLCSAHCVTGRFAPARNRNANNRSSSPPRGQHIDTVAPARYEVPT